VAIYHTTLRVLETLRPASAEARDGGAKRIALTTWETQPLPAAYKHTLAGYDAVIVPSDFCRSVIGDAYELEIVEDSGWSPIVERSGILEQNRLTTLDRGGPPIHVVPHCFDEAWWPLPEVRDRDEKDAFRFISIGAWGERKNMLGLLRAYLHAFTKVDQVQLALMIDKPDFDEIRSLVARSGRPPHLLPELHIPDYVSFTERELVELYVDADCYVTATRAEGWGLGEFGAAIMGKHIIAPMWGGQEDFLYNYGLHRSVPHQMTPCFGGESRNRLVERDGNTFQATTVSLPFGVDCKQMWGDPDLVAIADQMRSLYDDAMNADRDLIEPLSIDDLRKERAQLEARFGYKTVGPLMANTLREIAWHSKTFSTH